VRGELVGVQYLRGLAAIFVIFFHAQGSLFPLLRSVSFNFGQSGVDVFFVISGFLMYRVTKRKGSKATARAFLRDRIIRIVPLYWITTIALAAVSLASPSLLKSTQFSVPHVILSLLFIPHYDPAHPKEIWPFLVPGWTLNYEMFFYVIFAVIIALQKNTSLLSTASIFGCLVVVGWLYVGTNPIILTYTAPLIAEFVFGIFIAYITERVQLPKYFAVLLPINLMVLIFISYSPSSPMRVIGWGIPAALLLLGALASEPWISSHKVRFLEEIGNSSYSIYLSHLFTLRVVGIFLVRNALNGGIFKSPVISAVVAIGASIFIGYILYRAIERPLGHILKTRVVHGAPEAAG